MGASTAAKNRKPAAPFRVDRFSVGAKRRANRTAATISIMPAAVKASASSGLLPAMISPIRILIVSTAANIRSLARPRLVRSQTAMATPLAPHRAATRPVERP